MTFTERNREATSAFISAVKKIGDDLGHPHGWKADVARRVGIGETALSHVMAGRRNLSARAAADFLAVLNGTPQAAAPLMLRAQAIADRVGMPVNALIDGWILAGVERAEKALS